MNKIQIKKLKDRTEWRLDGKLHREDGPAVEHPNGSKEWFIHGKRHREDGPAIEWSDGTKEWYLNYLLHREDGPAVESADGSKFWYLNGENFTEDEFLARTQGKKITVAEIEAKLGHKVEVIAES